MIQAVIFDLDGTLIDTEKYYRVCWPKALAAYGYTLTDEQTLALRSLGRPFAQEQFREWFGDDFDYPTVRAFRKKLMEECLAKAGVVQKAGAREVLMELQRRGMQVALATATDEERTERYLKQAHLWGLFDQIICATMVERGKPAPDIYLYACRKLGRQPGECMAVEDAPNGVLSAYRAGCRVVMVPDQTQPDEKLSALLYAKADTLTDILPLLFQG